MNPRPPAPKAGALAKLRYAPSGRILPRIKDCVKIARHARSYRRIVRRNAPASFGDRLVSPVRHRID